jgi:hypothetical protein
MIRQNNDTGYVLNLDGPEGNAFVLLGAASNLCRELDYNKDEVMEDLQAGDYNHLLVTFEGYFGPFVTLETNNPEYLALFA